MKHLLSFLLCLASVLGYTQNGGQSPENNNIKFEYVGKVGNDYFTKIINKKECAVTVKTDYNQAFSEVVIPANSYHQFNLGANVSSLKAKTVQVNCGSPDNGWIEFKLTAMPLTFKRVWFQRDQFDKNRGVLSFEVADVQNVKHIAVRAWLDVNTKIEVSLFWPNPLNPNTVYQYPINDIQALVTRIKNHK